MTREEIDLLDGMRVWHKEQAELKLMHAEKARINKQGFLFAHAHHALAAELIEKAVAELTREAR